MLLCGYSMYYFAVFIWVVCSVWRYSVVHSCTLLIYPCHFVALLLVAYYVHLCPLLPYRYSPVPLPSVRQVDHDWPRFAQFCSFLQFRFAFVVCFGRCCSLSFKVHAWWDLYVGRNVAWLYPLNKFSHSLSYFLVKLSAVFYQPKISTQLTNTSQFTV